MGMITLQEYYSSMPLEWRQKFVAKFTEPLHDKQSRANVSLRRGYCSALGYLPPQLLQDASLARLVVPALIQNIKLEENANERDPESRQRAAESLGRLADTFTDEEGKNLYLHQYVLTVLVVINNIFIPS